jgi:hypothetical protein
MILCFHYFLPIFTTITEPCEVLEPGSEPSQGWILVGRCQSFGLRVINSDGFIQPG